jgi:hypothetical protein
MPAGMLVFDVKLIEILKAVASTPASSS